MTIITNRFDEYIDDMFTATRDEGMNQPEVSMFHERAETLEASYRAAAPDALTTLLDEWQITRGLEYEHYAAFAYRQGYVDCVALLKRLVVL